MLTNAGGCNTFLQGQGPLRAAFQDVGHLDPQEAPPYNHCPLCLFLDQFDPEKTLNYPAYSSLGTQDWLKKHFRFIWKMKKVVSSRVFCVNKIGSGKIGLRQNLAGSVAPGRFGCFLGCALALLLPPSPHTFSNQRHNFWSNFKIHQVGPGPVSNCPPIVWSIRILGICNEDIP